jgi:hypothetical protein
MNYLIINLDEKMKLSPKLDRAFRCCPQKLDRALRCTIIKKHIYNNRGQNEKKR